MERNDPYLILLRRELTRAQARLRRAERERDALRAALAKIDTAAKPKRKRASVGIARKTRLNDSK